VCSAGTPSTAASAERASSVALSAIQVTSAQVGTSELGAHQAIHHSISGADFTGQGPFWHNAFGKCLTEKELSDFITL
jgi:hypothetical protein